MQQKPRRRQKKKGVKTKPPKATPSPTLAAMKWAALMARNEDDKLHSMYGPLDIKLQKAILKLDDSTLTQLDKLTEWSTRTLSISMRGQTLQQYLEERPYIYKLYTHDSALCVCLEQARIYTLSEFAERYRQNLPDIAEE